MTMSRGRGTADSSSDYGSCFARPGDALTKDGADAGKMITIGRTVFPRCSCGTRQVVAGFGRPHPRHGLTNHRHSHCGTA